MNKVEYACFVNNTGFGHAALGYISCLQTLSVPLRIRPLHPLNDTSWMSSDDLSAIHRSFIGEADISIWHSIPPRWGGLKRGRIKNVVVCTFECGQPPSDWIRLINRDGTHAMYPSEFCRREFEAAGVSIPGVTVRHLVRDCFFECHPRGYSGGTMVLLAVGAWKTRKNWHNLIQGIASALRSGIDLRLIIKTDKPSIASSEVRRLVPEAMRERFLVVDGSLTDRSMAGLYASCDAFICASRGEGFCLPVAQAMAAGVPVISTRSGGIADFFDESCGTVIDSAGIETLSMDGYPQFSSKAWPIITADSIGRAVGQAFEKYHELISGSARVARIRAGATFSRQAVCESMKEVVGIT
jgi:glycosyltransferase involved in cell wall biosynthesis